MARVPLSANPPACPKFIPAKEANEATPLLVEELEDDSSVGTKIASAL